MKKTSLFLAWFVLASGAAIAQEHSKQDSTKIKIGDLKLIVVGNNNDDKSGDCIVDNSKEALTHWGGLDLGVSILVDKSGKIDFTNENAWLDLNYAKSLSWNFNFFETKIRLFKDYAGIITGIGLTYNSFGLRDSVVVKNVIDKITYNDSGNVIATTTLDSTYGVFNSGLEYTKNKFRTTQLRVPLLLEFNTSLNNERSFHLAVGVIGGWRFSNVTKREYRVEGNEYKERSRGDYNTNDFTVDAAIRIGYNDFTLYANSALTPLFKSGKGPKVYPVSIGLSVIPW